MEAKSIIISISENETGSLSEAQSSLNPAIPQYRQSNPQKEYDRESNLILSEKQNK